MLAGAIHSIETFGAVDGPGIRFVIFLQGCALRCQYCHNADTWDKKSNDIRTVDEVLAQAERYRSYWGNKGGITVSGGEPLLQIDFLIDLFKEAKNRGINTCIDTAGQPFTKCDPFISKFNELMKYTDLLMVDIKHIDEEKHKLLTGQTNKNILEMLTYLSEINKPVWIRQVLVPTITDDDKWLYETRAFIETLSNVQKIEVLPYHSFGKYKWDLLGIPYKLDNIASPSEERVKNAERILNGQQ